ncbi:MAG: hypothetical protein UX87_C0026G0012 [Candidatus Amesbacteria bacterium GW2011_GWA1_47_16]|uniref:Uncharacterized protein n=3 Tax=Candidatus Amesiibacteriota TaxID=1752730 RepID=A0A0G1S325_9BACT|nr:MAG: hypothetical protein UX87_C0026G0012 [Candidatus Amesbacteria bacterium GW2011_GWA1_47_16]KKU63767.1 MAG: hypothetical protein UX86_C0018G0003 [Candidatus Amesbacteria bacterium GW2011_GWC1_47_15]OGC99293.1 MAG: hypothetical protein A2701_01030 [Candidatus Amesbacteria bacterium RIFCSPHIGHO2_01_FULL_47_34]OGC99710.1 MAG: hypothetical protein A2972_00580 [Candidatus Amesbacteria bacterium RIFCSPLOWO2_01_FULL_47_33]
MILTEKWANSHITGLNELPDNAALIAANHPFLLCLAPSILALACKFPDVRIVSDAGLVSWLKVMGIATIPVNTKSNLKHACSKSAFLKMKVTDCIFRFIGTKYDEIDNRSLPGRISSGLADGNSIFIAPSGQGHPDAVWRPGIGYAIQEIVASGQNPVLSFLLIQNKIPWHGNITLVEPLNNVLDRCRIDPKLVPAKEIAAGLQRFFNILS